MTTQADALNTLAEETPMTLLTSHENKSGRSMSLTSTFAVGLTLSEGVLQRAPDLHHNDPDHTVIPMDTESVTDAPLTSTTIRPGSALSPYTSLDQKNNDLSSSSHLINDPSPSNPDTYSRGVRSTAQSRAKRKTEAEISPVPRLSMEPQRGGAANRQSASKSKSTSSIKSKRALRLMSKARERAEPRGEDRGEPMDLAPDGEKPSAITFKRSKLLPPSSHDPHPTIFDDEL
jgi:hypothetical protein